MKSQLETCCSSGRSNAASAALNQTPGTRGDMRRHVETCGDMWRHEETCGDMWRHFIGCIIGRQGSKINEIRQISGAHVKIASATDGSAMRQVTITGSPASISVAQYLINASLEMAKYTMQAASSATPVDLNMGFPHCAPSTAAASMAILAASTQAPTINVHSPSALQSPHYVPVSSLLGMKGLPLLVHPAASSSLTHGLCPYTGKMLGPGIKKSDRQKFAPY
ncbi:Poly(rC)-binding protein 4 [Liparis tanakae]|uniref:Poly(RC)-binding protein 4 n=1 Tax=Liparis tanakae TaxID=230148 RepID=A0A4Z2EEL4_9TELE|nr:Poly(rC)-binding protein 4 [Liparis tanakae]